MKYIYVAIGAIVGSTCRYLLSLAIPVTIFPFHTLIVNCLGSLLLGVTAFHPSLTIKWRLMLGVGCFGSFTTFSTFAMDIVKLFNQQFVLALLYVLISIILGISCAFLGMKIATDVRWSP